MCLTFQACVEKTVYWEETHWPFCKEKVLGAAANKEGDADILLGYEITCDYWFLKKKCSTMKNVFYCQLKKNLAYLLNDPRIYGWKKSVHFEW